MLIWKDKDQREKLASSSQPRHIDGRPRHTNVTHNTSSIDNFNTAPLLHSKYCKRKYFIHPKCKQVNIPDSQRMITFGEECTWDMITEQGYCALMISEPRKIMWFLWIHDGQHEIEHKDINRVKRGAKASKYDFECERRETILINEMDFKM